MSDNLVVHLGKGTNAEQAPALLHVRLPRVQVNCWCGTFLPQDWHPNGAQELGVHAAQSPQPSPAG